jgi:hypothetical protein
LTNPAKTNFLDDMLMKINPLPAAWLILSALAPAAWAQRVPVNVVVGDITDTRTTSMFNSECKLELKFTGDAAADALSVRAVHVKQAVDDLGRDLVPKADSDSMHPPMGMSGSGERSGALKTELVLRNPSRHSAVIKLIEGNVEFFSPTPANGGTLVIKDIFKHPAETVQNDTLKKYGVELTYLTKESYEAKKKQMQAQQRDNPGAAMAQGMGDMFSGMFSGMMSSSSPNTALLYVKDPDKRVIDVEYQDANGKALKRRSSWSSNEMRSQEFSEPPPPDTQLLVYLATPEAIQSVPFKIENVPLP